MSLSPSSSDNVPVIRFLLRLKLLLLGVLIMLAIVLLRCVQIQVFQHSKWVAASQQVIQRGQLVDTTRGTILDYKGREVAVDTACIDVCVDYRAITPEPDPKWLRDQALARLRARGGLNSRQRTQLIEDEQEVVRGNINLMWAMLARLPGQSAEGIAQTRQTIVRQVEMRRQAVLYRTFDIAVEKYKATSRPSTERSAFARFIEWLPGQRDEGPTIDQFDVQVGEQIRPHVILHDVNDKINNELAKRLESFPGLSLRPGVARKYPYGETGCHLLGHMSRVDRDDLTNDPFNGDDLREYLPTDEAGRGGLEALAEPILRGRRGKVVRIAGSVEPMEETAAIPGQSVTTTIDFELQKRMTQLFAHAKFKHNDDHIELTEMHGAAVVIDVATGEVRALASYPVYNPNTLDTDYKRLSTDDINQPLLNRATMAALEPGSTVKPLIGMSTVTAGLSTVADTVQCTGYLILNGIRYSMGRCWTMTEFHTTHTGVPSASPHPSGMMDMEDAIQRSCNVYFETMGDRMGIDRLSEWMGKWGLGHVTGIGIAESPGRVPNQVPVPAYLRRSTAWFAGIGQGKVLATPLQMANVAATIARGGIWVRPTLLSSADKSRLDTLKARQPSTMPVKEAASLGPDRYDLHIKPAALAAAHSGMVKVVNTEAGTAKVMARTDMVVAGKTGTAQAAPFRYRLRDKDGNFLTDAAGKIQTATLQLSTDGAVNPQAPWYRGTGKSGTDRAHAWFIGFAPAENPKIAFAVLVEYGGAGGRNAAPIAKDVLQACIDAGYLGEAKTEGQPALGMLVP